MTGSFKSKKKYALLFCALSGVFFIYSWVNFEAEPKLVKEIQVISDTPRLKSGYAKAHRTRWLEFQFENQYNTVYKLPEPGLKYTLYNDLKKDLQLQDTVLLEVDGDNVIYSLSSGRKEYVDKSKILEWNYKNHQFTLFLSSIMCLACLPILFFKQQPKFWHSGFEYEFSFSFLFFAIITIAFCIYIYCNGTEYLFASADIP